MSMFAKLKKEYGGFEIVSEHIRDEDLDKYCDAVYQQYCNHFHGASYLKNVEWLLRHYDAAKKMTLSGLFYTQAQYLFAHKVRNVCFYSLYYSLFNAFSSNILMLPQLPLDKVQRISHGRIFNYIDNYLVRLGIYPIEAIKLLNELRLMRELYSYHLPLGGSFMRGGEDFNLNSLFPKIDDLLPAVLQVSNMLSYLSHYAWNKKVGKALDEYSDHQSEVDQMFFSFIEHHDHLGHHCLIDNDDYQRQGWVLRNMQTPFPISWFITEKMCEDLECGWEHEENEGYDINEVGRYLARAVNAF